MNSKREVTGGQQTTRKYHVVALQVPIVFNFDGDHDHNGMIFALGHNKGELDDLREEIAGDNDSPSLKTPHPLVRPLVLRAAVGETVEIDFVNHIRGRRVGIHLIADRYDVNTSDGAHVGTNPSSLAGPPYEAGEVPDPTPRNERSYTWRCVREGVFPFHDAGNLSGGEDGTNVHGLFGALVVEPAGSAWSDPVTGDRLDEPLPGGGRGSEYWGGDGLYMDVHPKGWVNVPVKKPFAQPPKYPFDPNKRRRRDGLIPRVRDLLPRRAGVPARARAGRAQSMPRGVRRPQRRGSSPALLWLLRA